MILCEVGTGLRQSEREGGGWYHIFYIGGMCVMLFKKIEQGKVKAKVNH